MDINPTPTRQVFVSGDDNHRLVRVPLREVQGPFEGTSRELNPALAYQFVEGYLVVDDELRERDRKFLTQYADQLGVTDLRPAEEWLRDHARFGLERGFSEIPLMTPDSGPVLGKVTDAVLAGDVGRLVELYQAEESGHARPDVLDHIERAITTLEEREGAAAG